MKNLFLLLTAGLLLATAAMAASGIEVTFTNDVPAPSGATNNMGQITLEYTVDGSGFVTLDATADNNATGAAYLDALLDGAAGWLSYTGAYGKTFRVVLTGSGGLSLSTWTPSEATEGGLGVYGGNAWIINANLPETITVSMVSADLALDMKSLNWGIRQAGNANMVYEYNGVAVTNALGSEDGSLDVSAENMVLKGGDTVVISAYTAGLAVQGLAFDITEGSLPPEFADLVPDVYSGGSYSNSTVDGKPVWITDNSNYQLYFDVPGTFNFVPGQPVYVRIEYLDAGSGRIFAEYDSTLGSATANKFQDAETHSRSSRVGSGKFVYNYQQFKYPLFNGRQNGGNDFRFKVLGSDGTPLTVASVQISTQPYDDQMFQYALSDPWLEPYGGETRDFVDNQTLAGKVMTGYQGWFGAPNDVMDEGWIHWGRGSNDQPDESWMTVDAWPYLDDYDTDDLYKAGDLLHQDGRPAYLFSSRDPATVQRHFRWMRKHGIDGAYLQYFVNASRSGANGAKKFVLNNVMEAAAKEGRIWALEYDVAELSTDLNTAMDIMTNDWNWMVSEAKITQDPRYAHEDGKPVVFIWGFPLEGNGFPVATADAVVDWFATQNVYLICGTRWRSEAEWQNHFRKYDQLLIWMERDLSTLASRKATLDGWGMKILPHAWPGFSWNNLQQTVYPYQYTARAAGDFYWDKLYNAVAVGADQIFLGMFDEYDEGTQIMPMSDNHPNIYSEGPWGHYIDNEGRDPFWYLQLSEAGREMLNGQRPLSSTIPLESEITPAAYAGEDATAYLGTNDVVAGLTHKQPADGLTDGLVLGSQNCRTNSKPYFYFDIDDALVYGVTEGQAATIELEYYDDAPGRTIRLQYDSVGAPYALHPDVEVTPGTGGWNPVRWNVDDAFFGNRQNGMSDFRINVTGGNVVAIRRVSVFLPEEQGGTVSGTNAVMEFVNDSLEWPDLYDAVGWRLTETDNLLSNDWQAVSGLVFTNGLVQYDLVYTNNAGFYQLRKPAKK